MHEGQVESSTAAVPVRVGLGFKSTLTSVGAGSPGPGVFEREERGEGGSDGCFAVDRVARRRARAIEFAATVVEGV